MSRSTQDRKDAALVDRARDELFSHIHRCGVLRATPEQQAEWMEDTMDYMAERFPDLSPEGLQELRAIGLRFCQPVISHNASATEEEGEREASEGEAGTGAAAA